MNLGSIAVSSLENIAGSSGSIRPTTGRKRAESTTSTSETSE